MVIPSAPSCTSSAAAARKASSNPVERSFAFAVVTRAGGAADDPVEDRERPSRGVADIAWDAGKAGLEHQDPDAGAVDGLAAVGSVRIVIHHHRPSCSVCATTLAMIAAAGGAVYR
jgi:hypothetical protein